MTGEEMERAIEFLANTGTAGYIRRPSSSSYFVSLGRM